MRFNVADSHYSQGLMLGLGMALLTACSAPAPREADQQSEAAKTGQASQASAQPAGQAPLNKDIDAQALLKPIPAANQPYTVSGIRYTPIPSNRFFEESGWASWYGAAHQGQRTASGELFDMKAYTAAHPILPIPSYVQLTNPANGSQAIVRINDRGPFREKRFMDVSHATAVQLGFAHQGLTRVQARLLTHDEALAWLKAGALQPEARSSARPPDSRTASVPASSERGNALRIGHYIQLGAYKDNAAALVLAQKADQAARDLKLKSSLVKVDQPLVQLMEADTASGRLARVLAGPYAARAEAEQAAGQLEQTLAVKPFITQIK